MYDRHLKGQILEALGDTPVVLLHGARQSGKSTLAQTLSQQDYPAHYFTLDDQGVRAAATRDSAGFLAGLSGPAVIDEVQRAPELLLAIKAEVDRRRRPGRFLITGSAHILSLPRVSDALAGRMEILTLWPLSLGEIEGRREGFIDALFDKKLPPLMGDGLASKADLVQRIMAGGYPEALARGRSERLRAWFDSYLDTILQREVRELANISGLTELPRLLQVLAARAGGLINFADLARDVQMNQVTLKRYFTLLSSLFIVFTTPPWFTNRIKRLMKSPKLYFGDTGLLSHVLELTPQRLARDPRAGGALFENFVAMELIKQRAWSRTRPRIYHFRDYAGTEVDLVLETPGGDRIVGVEVKAGATVSADDFKGLRALAEHLGPRFHRGVVLYSGQSVVPFAKNLHALPLSFLWILGAAKKG